MLILSILAILACIATSIGVFVVAPRLTGKLTGLIPLAVWIGADVLPLLSTLAERRGFFRSSLECYLDRDPGATVLALAGQLVAAALGSYLLMQARNAKFRMIAEEGADGPLAEAPVMR